MFADVYSMGETMERKRQQATRSLRLRTTVLLFLGIFSLGLAVVDAQASGQLLTVSKPPASLLPTDPPQGLVYTSPADLASAEVFFDAASNPAGGPISLVYIVVDAQGAGYLTFDDGPDENAPGGVMIVPDLLTRAERTFDAERDRLITGALTGLAEPKDLLVLEDLGFIVVADFARADIKVFDALSSGNVAPFFTTNNLGLSRNDEPRRPWGLAYDEAADRLFVGATDGTLLVYDTFIARQGEGGPDRVVTPTFGGEPMSHNLHELVYLTETDTVAVVDVGAAATSDQPEFDSDGSLFTIQNAGRVEGPTPVGLWLHGPASLLGNPVSLALRGDDIFIGDAALDLVLRFDGLLDRQGEVEATPDAALSIVKPESVILVE